MTPIRIAAAAGEPQGTPSRGRNPGAATDGDFGAILADVAQDGAPGSAASADGAASGRIAAAVAQKPIPAVAAPLDVDALLTQAATAGPIGNPPVVGDRTPPAEPSRTPDDEPNVRTAPSGDTTEGNVGAIPADVARDAVPTSVAIADGHASGWIAAAAAQKPLPAMAAPLGVDALLAHVAMTAPTGSLPVGGDGTAAAEPSTQNGDTPNVRTVPDGAIETTPADHIAADTIVSPPATAPLAKTTAASIPPDLADAAIPGGEHVVQTSRIGPTAIPTTTIRRPGQSSPSFTTGADAPAGGNPAAAARSTEGSDPAAGTAPILKSMAPRSATPAVGAPTNDRDAGHETTSEGESDRAAAAAIPAHMTPLFAIRDSGTPTKDGDPQTVTEDKPRRAAEPSITGGLTFAGATTDAHTPVVRPAPRASASPDASSDPAAAAASISGMLTPIVATAASGSPPQSRDPEPSIHPAASPDPEPSIGPNAQPDTVAAPMSPGRATQAFAVQTPGAPSSGGGDPVPARAADATPAAPARPAPAVGEPTVAQVPVAVVDVASHLVPMRPLLPASTLPAATPQAPDADGAGAATAGVEPPPTPTEAASAELDTDDVIAARNVRAASPALATEVAQGAGQAPVRQIADAVTTLAAETSRSEPATTPAAARPSPARSLVLHLAPATLGTITVRLHIADGRVSVRLDVEKQTTLGLIGHSREALQAAIGATTPLDQLVIQSADSAPQANTGSHDATRTNADTSPDRQAGGQRGNDQPSRQPERAPREARASGAAGRDDGLFV